MSKSRLDEMMEVVTELRTEGISLETAISNAEERLSLLRAIRRATADTSADSDNPVTPRGKRQPVGPRSEDC